MIEDPDQSPSARRLLAKVEHEVEAGRLWRAREILQGAIRQNATDVVVLERYARILEQLGDRVEAGKYFFLSGERGPDADAAISLFLTRHGRGHLNNIIAQFPSGAVQAGLDAFPVVVRRDLENLGLPATEPKKDPFAPETRTELVADRVALAGCWAAGLVITLAIPVGLVTIVRWLISLWR